MHASFHILTFGCQMNVNDSDWLARSLRQRGFTESALEAADVIILNTCSVRDKPEQKVYNALSRIRHATRHNPRAFAVVAGCVAQQVGAAFFDRFPQVRLVVGGDGMAGAPDAIVSLCADPEAKLTLTEFSPHYPERDPALGGLPAPGTQPDPGQRLPLLPFPPVAYVNIMQGCDNYCAYCIVPYTRGRQKSRSTAAVLAECRAVLAGGAREITLLGQNVNAFGQDSQGDGTSFASLLHAVAALPGLQRLRFVTPHPKDFSPEVVQAFADLEILCPRLHLPLQAGSDRVLARMGRRYDRARFLDIVANLRKARPDIALSTDLIVGFPGETEEDFQQTCEMMERVGFMSSFSFCYSDRPGTRAEKMPDKILPEVQLQRLSRLQALQDSLGQAWLQTRVAQHSSVLLEGASRKAEHSPLKSPDTGAANPAQGAHESRQSWQGHDPYGVTVNLLLAEGAGAPGQLVPVRIVAAKKHSLLAQCL